MAKKKLPKLPKWMWWLLWLVGILASLFLILYASFQVWVSTWQTYRNDEFGFSFRYPKSWYISRIRVLLTKESLDKYGFLGFYVDSKSELPNSPQDPIRSPGDVHISIGKNNTIAESRKQQGLFPERVMRYGIRTGRVSEGVSQTPDGLFVFMKELFVETSDGFFYVNTLTYSDDPGLWPKLKAKLYHRIGSQIIDSFIFTK